MVSTGNDGIFAEGSNNKMRKELIDDELMEILMNLGPKSLLRFRCVSKQWLNVISSPYFVRAHHNHTSRDEFIVIAPKLDDKSDIRFLTFRSNDDSLNVASPDLELETGYTSVLGSCSGLICIVYWHNPLNLLLCNPAQREFKYIRRPRGSSYLSNDRIGFGLDPQSNDFKIVSIVNLKNLGPNSLWRRTKQLYRVEIYDLSLDSWRKIDARVPEQFHYDCRQVYLKGACHWMAGNEWGDFFRRIIAFDLSSELFRTIEFPKDFPNLAFLDFYNPLLLTVLHQRLAVVYYEKDGRCVDIWVMKEYGKKESCSKMYKIGPFRGMIDVLSSWRDEELLINDCFQLFSCDVKANKTKQLEPLRGTTLVFRHKESLVSINSKGRTPARHYFWDPLFLSNSLREYKPLD